MRGIDLVEGEKFSSSKQRDNQVKLYERNQHLSILQRNSKIQSEHYSVSLQHYGAALSLSTDSLLTIIRFCPYLKTPTQSCVKSLSPH